MTWQEILDEIRGAAWRAYKSTPAELIDMGTDLEELAVQMYTAAEQQLKAEQPAR